MSMVPHYSGSSHRGGIYDPFAMDAFDPFKEFNRHALSMHTSNLSSDASLFVNTSIDWRETPEAHIFKADLPGMKKDEVKVELEDDRVLQIRGERSRDLEQSSDRWHRVERSSGKFVRRFRLPENARMDQIQASMEHGVLTVTVPKDAAKNRALKAIDISG